MSDVNNNEKETAAMAASDYEPAISNQAKRYHEKCCSTPESVMMPISATVSVSGWGEDQREGLWSDGHRTVRKHGQPSAGGAHSIYHVDRNCDDQTLDTIQFQHDVIEAVGVRGWTNEALLAVVISRLRGFQYGPYPCQENATALTLIETALTQLEDRTRNRKMRGVEGKHRQ